MTVVRRWAAPAAAVVAALAVAGCGVSEEAEPVLLTTTAPAPPIAPTATSVQPAPAEPPPGTTPVSAPVLTGSGHGPALLPTTGG